MKKSSKNRPSYSRTRSTVKHCGYEHLERRDLLATFVVNTIIDDATGVADELVSLREAIMAAETNAAFGDAAAGDVAGDIIRFDASLAGQTITLSAGAFEISDDVAVNAGNLDITINAASLDRAFTIDSGERVVLRGLNITGGLTSNDGGAIKITGAGITILNDLEFTANVAMGTGGGAVATADNRVTVMGSTFDQNIASGMSGSGGAILISSGEVGIYNSGFTANIANRAGGAIEIIDGGVSIVGSTLGGETAAEGNVAGPAGTAAPGNGGALHVTGQSTRTFIGNSTVSNNLAASEGGGLWNQMGDRSTMSVINSVVSNNVAMGDDADNGGGGIFNNGGKLQITNSMLTGNSATGASGSGGGLFSTDGRITITETEFSTNAANRAGGGIEIVDGVLYIADSTLSTNVAGPEGSASPGNGGALHVTGNNLTYSSFVRTSVVDNVAAREGGGLWNQTGSAIYVRNSDISDNVAHGDAADDGGGGIFNNSGEVRVNSTMINRNFATGLAGSGGGVFSTGGVVSLINSTILENVANRAGGGVEVVNGRFILMDSMLGSNIAGPEGSASPGNGGGLHVSGTGGTQTIVSGGVVAGNVAASEGGGLWNQNGSSMLVTNDVFVEGNVAMGDSADTGGGGIFNNGGNVTVTNATIRGNRAIGTSGSGGGIFSTDGNVTVRSSSITSNTANRAGGGVELIDGMFLLFDSTLGAAAAGNVAGPAGSAAPGNGGGLHVSGSDSTYVAIDRSFVGFNTAANEGGGLWNQSGSTMVVRNGSIISQNSAGAGGGGGLFNRGGTMNVFDSTIVRNTSTGNGGGVGAIAGSVTRIHDSSISSNTAVNGGGFANDGQTFVRDSFFAFNDATVDGGGLFTDVNGQTDVLDSGFFGNTPNDQN